MPKKTRPLGPPPDERPNWDSMNEGQRRYAYEQYNLARVRRSLPIDHPIPVPDSSLVNEPSPAANQDIPEDMAPPVERSAGTPQQKRPAEEELAAQTSKASRSGDIFQLPGTGENYPVANQGGNNGVVMIPRPFESHHVQFRTYKKVHRFLTFGLAYTGMLLNYEYEYPGPEKTTVKKSHNNALMATPMAYIPWEWDFMYLNPSEYELLPDNSYCVEVKMKVSAQNIRIAFPTNASTTELATLNQNKFIRYGEALLQNVPTVNGHYTKFKDGNPMVPEQFKTFHIDDMKKFMISLYGEGFDRNSVEATWVSVIPNAQFGLPCTLPHYLMVCNDPEYGEGWPSFQSYCTEINADNITGQVITEMSYKPQAGYLKSPAKAIYTGFPNLKKTDTRNIVLATGPIDARGNITMNRDKGGDFMIATGQHTDRTDFGAVTYGNIIEKSQTSCRGLYEVFSPQTQPSFHIGVQPVPSLTTANLSTPITSFTDSQGYFIIETEMIVRCESDTLRPFATFTNCPPHEEIHRLSNATFSMEKSMYYGLMQK
uniref:Structural protein n=1 Tax=Phylloscopus fuscatus parvoviridae sp. TaxID=2794534 RepID=A0A8E7G1P0_9VIRU|nr:MAG: structural protein [Phylloscopus fuscatus parvoviridae sp.]